MPARAAIVLILCASWGSASGQCLLDHLVEDAGPSSGYSKALAVSEDYLIIGASNALDDEGAAFVYRQSGTDWVLDATLTAIDGISVQDFGQTVAADGIRVAVGAAFERSVHVFRRDPGGWVPEDVLVNDTPFLAHDYGKIVAIHGDRIVVGSPTPGTGRAFVYHRAGAEWELATVLEPPGGAMGDRFAHDVGIHGDSIIIGAPEGDSFTSLQAGEAYFFAFDGSDWTFDTIVAQSGVGNFGNFFGGTVSIHGDRAAVGEPEVDEDTGQVTIFTREGGIWLPIGEVLQASDGMEEENFGTAVALGEDHLIVGAHDAGGAGPGAGAVYLFTYVSDTWTEVAEIVPPAVDEGDNFGLLVDVTSGVAALAAATDESTGIGTGSVYVYAVDGEDCDGNGEPDYCDIAAGNTADDNLNGIPDLCEPGFVRGDANGDGTFAGLADGQFILEYGFLGGPTPSCLEAADADGDGILNALQDAMVVLTHQFLGGPPPAAPFPSCGLDGDLPYLGCDVGTCVP